MIPWNRWIHWNSDPFKENSIDLCFVLLVWALWMCTSAETKFNFWIRNDKDKDSEVGSMYMFTCGDHDSNDNERYFLSPEWVLNGLAWGSTVSIKPRHLERQCPGPIFFFWNNLVLASPLSGLAPFLGYPGFPTAIAHRLWCFFLFSINQKRKKKRKAKNFYGDCITSHK